MIERSQRLWQRLWATGRVTSSFSNTLELNTGGLLCELNGCCCCCCKFQVFIIPYHFSSGAVKVLPHVVQKGIQDHLEVCWTKKIKVRMRSYIIALSTPQTTEHKKSYNKKKIKKKDLNSCTVINETFIMFGSQ